MNPFSINKRARAVILSYKADENLIEFIKQQGIEIIFTMKSNVDDRIDDHADLQVHPITYDRFISALSCYEYYKTQLEKFGVEVIKGNKELDKVYPSDCAYNVARVGDFYISKKDVVDEVLEKELVDLGGEGIFQKQAYAKCSSICFDDFVITCDKSIFNVLCENGIEAYFVSNEEIKLPGFNIGFLGGCCGIIDYKKILFTGDLGLLRDFNILKEILDKKGIEIIYPNCELIDLGSIIPVI